MACGDSVPSCSQNGLGGERAEVYEPRVQRGSVRASRLRESSGLTLGETMLAIALTLILGAVATPTANGILLQHRLSIAANHLALELVRARAIAISRSADVRVVVVKDGYFMQERDGASAAWESLGGFISLPSVITVSALKSREAQFTSTGMATSNEFVLSNGRSTKAVVINRLGSVKVS